MRQRVVVTHFFNEEYLLPWWLSHHTPLFDHGILIDYASTDRSREICRALAPNWEVRSSRNSYFGAMACDEEVMDIEAEYPDAWKIALNTTEFFCARDIEGFVWSLERHGWRAYALRGLVLAEPQGAAPNEPDVDRPLLAQIHHGYFEDQALISGVRSLSRSRLFHREKHGQYRAGRHWSELSHYMHPPGALLAYLLYSPWTERFIQRKLQIAARIPESDRKYNHGTQHFVTREELEAKRKAEAAQIQDLRHHPDYERILGGWHAGLYAPSPPRAYTPVLGLIYDVPCPDPVATTQQVLLQAMQTRSHDTLKLAENLCRNALDRTPSDPTLRMLYALQCVIAGDAKSGQLLLEQSLREHPGHAASHHNLGVLLARAQHTQEAQDHFAHALRLNPHLARVPHEGFVLAG